MATNARAAPVAPITLAALNHTDVPWVRPHDPEHLQRAALLEVADRPSPVWGRIR